MQNPRGQQAAERDDLMEWDVRHDAPAGGGSGQTGGDGAGFPDFLSLGEAGGETPSSFNFDPRRFIIGAWQRRYVAGVVFASLTALLFLLIMLGVPRQWQANMTLIKRSHQDLVTLAERDPFKSQDYSLATLLDTLKLSSSLKQVAEDSGLEVSTLALATAIGVNLSRDSTILNLSLTWDDPVVAAELINRVAEQFIERTMALVRDDAAEGFQYYSSQLELARKQAREASADVLEFRQANGISNLDTQTRVLLEDLSSMKGEYNALRAEVDALHQARQRISDYIAAEPEQMIMYTIYRSPLQTRLADYEWELQEALTRYTEENPKVIKLRDSIRTLEEMIAASNDESVPENTYMQNNKRYQMEMRLQELEDEIQVKEAQARATSETLADMQASVDTLNGHEKEYLMLQSRLEGILTLETNLSRRVEETRLVMQRQDGIFDVVERATPPLEPLPSGRKLLALGSLVLAGGSALLLVLFLEWRDPFVRSLRDATDIAGGDAELEIPTGRGKLIKPDKPMSPIANDFRRLCNDMDNATDAGPERFGVISVGQREGRSTVAANLALSRVMKGQRALLVDADLRSTAGPRPDAILGLRVPGEGQGLAEHLQQNQRLAISPHFDDRLQVLASGKVVDSHALLELGVVGIAEVLDQSAGHRHVVADLPPLDESEVSLELAAELDGVVLVAQSGQTRRDALKAAAARLQRRNIRVRAVLLLGVAPHRLATAPLIEMSHFQRWLPERWRGEAHHA